MAQVNAPQLQTPMGYEPTTQLWLPFKVKALQIDTVNGEEYAVLAAQLEPASDQGTNPIVTQEQIRALVLLGQVYMMSIQAVSTAVSNAAIMLWGGVSGITKRTILLSATAYSSAGNSNIAFLRTLSAIDAGVATQQAPVNQRNGGGASLYTGANAAVNVPTAAATVYTGTAIRHAPAIPQANVEVLPPGGYVIPANSGNTGIEVTMSQGSAGMYIVTLAWAEL